MPGFQSPSCQLVGIRPDFQDTRNFSFCQDIGCGRATQNGWPSINRYKMQVLGGLLARPFDGFLTAPAGARTRESRLTLIKIVARRVGPSIIH